jgi:ribosomal protein L40E
LTALIVGTLLALGALTFVLYPLLMGGGAGESVEPFVPFAEPERNVAIDALREIEFDRETGKLSDVDYDSLKATYTQQAITAMRSSNGPVCPRCGPRPEVDARFCSSCGSKLES